MTIQERAEEWLARHEAIKPELKRMDEFFSLPAHSNPMPNTEDIIRGLLHEVKSLQCPSFCAKAADMVEAIRFERDRLKDQLADVLIDDESCLKLLTERDSIKSDAKVMAAFVTHAITEYPQKWPPRGNIKRVLEIADSYSPKTPQEAI